ncbi:unnamed protein product, partial [Iphiclides podalirius]
MLLAPPLPLAWLNPTPLLWLIFARAHPFFYLRVCCTKTPLCGGGGGRGQGASPSGQSKEEEIWINKEIARCPMEAAASTHTGIAAACGRPANAHRGRGGKISRACGCAVCGRGEKLAVRETD